MKKSTFNYGMQWHSSENRLFSKCSKIFILKIDFSPELDVEKIIYFRLSVRPSKETYYKKLARSETSRSDPTYNFPYLDIYLSKTIEDFIQDLKIEFYHRGAKDRNLEFNNLFEYLLWSTSYGKG